MRPVRTEEMTERSRGRHDEQVQGKPWRTDGAHRLQGELEPVQDNAKAEQPSFGETDPFVEDVADAGGGL